MRRQPVSDDSPMAQHPQRDEQSISLPSHCINHLPLVQFLSPRWRPSLVWGSRPEAVRQLESSDQAPASTLVAGRRSDWMSGNIFIPRPDRLSPALAWKLIEASVLPYRRAPQEWSLRESCNPAKWTIGQCRDDRA